jgi:hypothetical protein
MLQDVGGYRPYKICCGCSIFAAGKRGGPFISSSRSQLDRALLSWSWSAKRVLDPE